MGGKKNPTNLELEKLVEKAGVTVSVLATPDQVVCDDEWTEEREQLAQELLRKDTSSIPEFWQRKYEHEAAKNWDKFYKRNTTNFYKDRYGISICGYTWSCCRYGSHSALLCSICVSEQALLAPGVHRPGCQA